jgi:hypothetical protein
MLSQRNRAGTALVLDTSLDRLIGVAGSPIFYGWFKMKFTVMKVSTSTGSPFKRVGL